MTYTRQKDPTQLPTQLNISLPWQDRQDYAEISANRGVSMAELVRLALAGECQFEMAEKMKQRTRKSGATS